MGYNNNNGGGMYARRPAGAGAGTVVPGMHVPADNTVATPEMTVHAAPTVGFLYSISRQGIGEYWPLHLGANLIGRDPGCDIVLKEGTVSGKHAVVNIKQMKSTGKVIAQIRDEGSKTGIYVNDEELDFGMHDCADRDLIRIGTGYLLLLILINPNEYGLKVSEDFIEAEPSAPRAPGFGGFSGDPGTEPGMYDASHRNENGTMSMDGDDNGFSAGGTQFL